MEDLNKKPLDVLAQLDLAETEVIDAKAWSAGEQAKKHCDFALTAIATARQAIAAAEQAQQVDPSQEWFDCLIEDVSAIDCMHRGDPVYEPDAYWMKDRVIKMLEKRRDAAQQQAVPVARDWPKIDAAMRDYVEGYEMIGDNNEVCYSPTKGEQELIIDCVRGLLAESDFINLMTAKPPAVAVPDGYALVPVVATDRMRAAGRIGIQRGIKFEAELTPSECGLVWAYMVGAAAQKGGA